MADRRQPVGDHDRGPACHQAPQTLLDQALGVHVDVGGCLIEDKYARIGDQRSRERDQLALAGRQLHAALADLRVVAVLELRDEFVGADGAGRRLDLLVWSRPVGRTRCSRGSSR